ncbi:hypothetical protein KUTeg_006860 [Tegillarca granosa]|uniref:Uncharacterized protein n=1 Tax=Tegillarca granosa TaxID=220873 RepID=A0ABQ9FEK3_TEGGR|nr:hypothetical protein KUTeg_006860 [Tegillarca granosa]
MAFRQEEADLDEELIEDDYDDIPDINLCINFQPYMYEPTFNNGDETRTSSNDSSDSDSDNGGDTQALPVDRWCSCDNCLTMPTA